MHSDSETTGLVQQATKRVVINSCFGGFSLSEKAIYWLREQGYQPAIEEVLLGETWEDGTVNDSTFNSYLYRPPSRDDELLIQCVETLGPAANGRFAELTIVEIPADVEYTIEEYDGLEHIAEKHRTWS